MTGIYGCSSFRDGKPTAHILDRMFHGLPSTTESHRYEWTSADAHAGIGVTQPKWKVLADHYAVDRRQSLACCLDGFVYDDSAPRNPAPKSAGAARRLLKGYLHDGVDHFARCNGSFNLALWDQRYRRLLLVNDKLGQRPLFYCHHNGNLLFASYLARLPASGLCTPEVDFEGFVDLLSYGFVLNDRTLFDKIRLLPPGSVLSWEKGKFEIHQFPGFDQIEPQGRYDTKRRDELVDIFRDAVARSLCTTAKTAISLTGGLDSRCILAAAANQRLPFVTQTGGIADSTDFLAAREMANTVNAEHYFAPLHPEHLENSLLPTIMYQGALVATLHSHAYHALDRPAPTLANVQGIGGEFTRGADWISERELSHTRLHGDTVMKKLSPNESARLRGISLWNRRYTKDAQLAAISHATQLQGKYNPSDHPYSILKLISLYDLCRIQLNKAIVVTRTAREIFLPYLDHRWVEAVAAIPLHYRIRHNIQKDLIACLQPELLKTVYTETLLPMDATRNRLRINQSVYRWTRRLESKTGIRLGPRLAPAMLYNDWIRGPMRAIISDLLHNPDAAFCEYLDRKVVNRLIDEHMSGKANWQHIISALTVFELAHHIWISPSMDFDLEPDAQLGNSELHPAIDRVGQMSG